MAYITCVKCGTENTSRAKYCIKCGSRLSHGAKIEPKPAVPTTYHSVQSSAYPSSRYTALRSIASVCNGLGWLIAGLAAAVILGILWAMFGSGGISKGVGFAGIVASIVFSGFCFIILRVIAESIFVLLDIESNTRQAANNTHRAASILEQQSN